MLGMGKPVYFSMGVWKMVNMAAIAVIDAQEKQKKKISTVLNKKAPYSIGVLLLIIYI
jgi:hypothetical protein